MRSMSVFNYLLEATVFGGGMIALLAAARALLRGRLGSRVLYVAWLLVAVRLLLPFTLPNPMMDGLRPAGSADAGARPVAGQARQRFIDVCNGVSEALSAGGAEEAPLAIEKLGEAASEGYAGKWALAVYAVAAACVGVWMAARHVRYRRRVWRDRVRALDGEALLCYHRLCLRYRLRPIPVFVVDPLPSACLVGAFHPFIAVPLHMPAEHMELTLAHELCHQKARDGLWALVRGLCCAVHWFNPLVWIAARLSRTDAELACDDRVTARLGDYDRLAYADMLASSAQRCATGLGALSGETPLAAKKLKARINAVIRSVKVRKWGVALASLLGACVLALSFATSESDSLPEIRQIPEVVWTAAPVSVQSKEDAVAYMRRFLESEFAGYRTSGMSFTAVREDGCWRVYASDPGHALPLLLRFREDGEVLEYDGTRVIGGAPRRSVYTRRAPTVSLNHYLEAFGRALLPETERLCVKTVSDDIRTDDMRYLTTALLDGNGSLLHQGIIQVEPVARVLYYRSGAYRDSAEAVRGPQDVQRTVLQDLRARDGLSEKLIDSGRFQCAWDETARAWRAAFTFPERTLAGKERGGRLEPDADGAENLLTRVWLIGACGEVVERGEWKPEKNRG